MRSIIGEPLKTHTHTLMVKGQDLQMLSHTTAGQKASLRDGALAESPLEGIWPTFPCWPDI